MANFDDLVKEAEDKDQPAEQPAQTETNGAERAEEVGSGAQQQIAEQPTEQPAQNQNPGFFGKLKNAFVTSPEDKQQREMAKMKAEEERLNSQLTYQNQKTALAKKKEQIAKIAQERRKNSPIGKTFSKIGGFVQQNAQQGKQVRNPLAEFGQSGLGAPASGQDVYGQNAGVNFGLAGRPAPAPKPAPVKKGKKSKMYKQQQKPAPTYQTQQPFGGGGMNTGLLNEFAPQQQDPFAQQPQSKQKPKQDLGLNSGRW